ncbi:AbgT family transporter [Paracoccus sp. J56]|uniref:AbgT family transporter n=1 Tax=Paracoccus sp. J56 TaxID=935850 RepID=UPI000A0DA3D3|nr:AbgT family transporter [Paracoccus sp. J56]SMG30450.1 aminobenzoyl-glutamate transport protein [Paracoccus sp. J56]
MTNETFAEPSASKGLQRAFRFFAIVEKVGNLLPNPFWLFWILSILLAGISALLAGASTTNPATGEEVTVLSMFTAEGLQMVLGTAVKNFATFPPMATIITVLLGIAVAQKSGLIDALLRGMVTRVPAKYLTFALSMAGMVGHVAGDAAYVTLIPLGAMVFLAAGRSPLIGIVVAYVSIAAGYDASPSLTTTDVLLSGLTTAAAHTIDPAYVVTPVTNYYFGLASSFLIALAITVVTEKVLVRRPDLQVDDDVDLTNPAKLATLETTPAARRAMRLTGLAALVFAAVIVLALVPANSPLRGEGGGIVNSVVFSGMAFILCLFFTTIGLVYGFVSGSFAKSHDIIDAMIDGVRSLAPILVLFFAIAQFLAYFKWTKIGEVMAITSAEWLAKMNVPGWAILLGIAILITFMNFVITSGSALWALAAPVFVPMLMLLNIPPETTQAVYRIADSVTNSVTPMSPYFVMALGFMQQYRKSAGIGTLASFTIPIAIVVWIVWMAFFMAWYFTGFPFGPGY